MWGCRCVWGKLLCVNGGEDYVCVCLCACTTTTVSVLDSVQDAHICDETISRFVFCGDQMNCDCGP